MKKILFFNDSLILAGTESLLVRILNHLHETRKAEVTLLLPYPSIDNILLEKLNKDIPVKYLHLEIPVGIRKKLAEVQLIFSGKISKKIIGYDLFVCFKEGFYANLFSRLTPNNILWIHNIIHKRQYTINSFKEILAVKLNILELSRTWSNYIKYQKVICVSNACKDAYLDLIHKNKQTEQNIQVLPNGVDIEKIKQAANIFVPNFNHNELNLVLVTRNSPDKAPERAFQLATYLREQKISYIKIHIIGLTGHENIAQSYENQQDILKYIHFYGQLDNPYPYIKHADWAICVSDRESFSLFVLEAIVLETPVITTACGGPEDILEYGVLGKIVKRTASALGDAVIEAIKYPQLNKDYIEKIKASKTDHSIETWFRQIEKCLRV